VLGPCAGGRFELESNWRWNCWFWQLGYGNAKLCARILDMPNRWLVSLVPQAPTYWFFYLIPEFPHMLEPYSPAPVVSSVPFPAGYNVEPDNVPM
jgi:hypothetical protein